MVEKKKEAIKKVEKNEKKPGQPVSKKDVSKKEQSVRCIKKKDESKVVPKVEMKPHLDPRMIGAITSLSVHYQEVVQPMLEHHSYNIITKSALINPNAIVSKPTILVIGTQQSGKSSLINYILQEEEGYSKKIDDFKSKSHNFTHLIHGLSCSYTSPELAPSNLIWPFNNMSELSTKKDGTELQIVTLNHQLLNEITFIDSPGINKNFGESKKDESGYMCLLTNLFERVDLIFFVGTPNTLKASMGKILDELNRISYKTIFVLNKCDEFKSENEFIRIKDSCKTFLSTYIRDNDITIFLTSLDGKKHEEKACQDFIDKDMALLINRIYKLPTAYKLSRIQSILKNSMQVFFIASIQNELVRRAKRQWAHITIKASEVRASCKDFMELNGSEKFINDNCDLITKSYMGLERSKWNSFKPEQVISLKNFLKIDLPYLLSCANDEGESFVKHPLPGMAKKEEEIVPKAPVSKRKVIKEIMIEVPQDDDDDDDEEENEKNKRSEEKKPENGENKECENKGDEKKEGGEEVKEKNKKKKKKNKQIKLDQTVLNQINN
uniref:G domain-containing protein n=1 Tax=Parastrongyloides trichosuri TaxID=131310 RepID=A0A0N5A7C1_PARTI